MAKYKNQTTWEKYYCNVDYDRKSNYTVSLHMSKEQRRELRKYAYTTASTSLVDILYAYEDYRRCEEF